jgi:hypothetical protein
MKEAFNSSFSRSKRILQLTVFVSMTIMAVVSLVVCYQAMQAEAHARYMGIKNVSAEKVARIIRGAEMNANNIFGNVERNLDSPEDVVAALKEKVYLNLDVRGYFAAFEPNYFPEKGMWFEPYLWQPDATGFEYRQVGSARHNYFKSEWYIRAKETNTSFWSDPYYYYDGTNMSGHYCTFVKPIFNNKGDLACVCGADMKFEWLAKELKWVDESSRKNNLLNKFHLMPDFNFYTVILNNDGTCLSHSEELAVNITDSLVLKNLAQDKSGITRMKANGNLCTVYYGPVEFVDWSVAVIVPQLDMIKPLLPMALILLLVIVIELSIMWFICKRN